MKIPQHPPLRYIYVNGRFKKFRSGKIKYNYTMITTLRKKRKDFLFNLSDAQEIEIKLDPDTLTVIINNLIDKIEDQRMFKYNRVYSINVKVNKNGKIILSLISGFSSL